MTSLQWDEVGDLEAALSYSRAYVREALSGSGMKPSASTLRTLEECTLFLLLGAEDMKVRAVVEDAEEVSRGLSLLRHYGNGMIRT